MLILVISFVKIIMTNEILNILDITDMLNEVITNYNGFRYSAEVNFHILTKCCVIFKHKAIIKGVKCPIFYELINILKYFNINYVHKTESFDFFQQLQRIHEIIIKFNNFMIEFTNNILSNESQQSNFENLNKKTKKFLLKFTNEINNIIIYNCVDTIKLKKAKKIILNRYKIKSIKKNREVFKIYEEETTQIKFVNPCEYIKLLKKSKELPSYRDLYPHVFEIEERERRESSERRNLSILDFFSLCLI